MWVYYNEKLNDHSNIIFDYHPTRKGENAKIFLQGFNGYLIRDGYNDYNVLKDVKHYGYMKLARRYFVNAMPKDKMAQKSPVAAEAVRHFDLIYHKEKLMSELTAEERNEQRLLKIKPLLDALFAWLENSQISGKKILHHRRTFLCYPHNLGQCNWLFCVILCKGDQYFRDVISKHRHQGASPYDASEHGSRP